MVSRYAPLACFCCRKTNAIVSKLHCTTTVAQMESDYKKISSVQKEMIYKDFQIIVLEAGEERGLAVFLLPLSDALNEILIHVAVKNTFRRICMLNDTSCSQEWATSTSLWDDRSKAPISQEIPQRNPKRPSLP